VDNPWDFIPRVVTDYSIMVINPRSSETRLRYLLENSDWSLLISDHGEKYRTGGKYNEKVFWYTSGTTGDSKFCSFTADQVDQLAQRICKSYDITANDRYTSIMPLWHAHGQGFYWATQQAQCQTTFLSIKELKNLPNNNPTFITAIPDMLKAVSNMSLGSLRFIRSASAAMPNSLYQTLQDKFSVPIIEAFGMTESLSHCFTNPLHGEQRIGTVGFPDGIEANIIHQKLFIKGPTVAATGWYDTGDLAEQDDCGYYKILGRHTDQIVIRGIKLNPVSLEKQLIESVPGLNECVLFGQDSIKCLYVGDCKCTDITNFLLNLGSYCKPKMIKQVDTIPVALSGKISRNYLNLLFP
jgi:oxalate---CoA ligase